MCDDLAHDHDLGLTLEFLRRNLLAFETADSEMERKTALKNYLSSLNTLLAHSYRIASAEGGTETAWVVQQKRRELLTLLEDIKGTNGEAVAGLLNGDGAEPE